MTNKRLTAQRRKNRSPTPWKLKISNGMSESAGGTSKNTASTSKKSLRCFMGHT